MRHCLVENKQFLNTIDILEIGNRLVKHEESINKIERLMVNKTDINKIMEYFITDKIKEFVILNGQKFEANEAYYHIYKQVVMTIYIIDDYINIDTLTLLKGKNEKVKVIIFSDNKGYENGQLRQLEFDNFNHEYPKLEIQYNRGICHDRYIILDYNTKKEIIFHCGASSKDAGNRVCTINQIMNREVLHSIVDLLLVQEKYNFNRETK